MQTPAPGSIDIRAVLNDLAGDTRHAADAAPGNPHLHARWQDVEQMRAAVNELLDAAADGHSMDASGQTALWFGPAKAARLQAALARSAPPASAAE